MFYIKHAKFKITVNNNINAVLTSLVLFTLAISSLLVVPGVYADDAFRQCNTCASTSSFYRKARAMAEMGVARDVYIINYESQNVKLFNVEMTSLSDIGFRDEPGVESTVTSVREKSISYSKMNSFRDLFDAHERIQLVLKSPKEIPTEVASSVYDLIGNTSIENDVKDWIRYNTSVFDTFMNYASIALTIGVEMYTGFDFDPTVYVKFSDGSYVRYEVTGVAFYGMELQFVEARDAFNNQISLNANDFINSTTLLQFRGNTAAAFAAVNLLAENLRELQIQVIFREMRNGVECVVTGGGVTCYVPNDSK
ncbi:MAG: hypothetical protein ACPG5K_06275 [Glaciecola sp.]|jgi:hypothetical protein